MVSQSRMTGELIMSSELVQSFTDGNFEEQVLNSDQPVLVDFWAEWCAPCRAIAPIVDQLADEYAGKARIGKVDTDSNRDTAIKYQITSIPTVLIFSGGEVVRKFVGLTSKKDLAEALDGL